MTTQDGKGRFFGQTAWMVTLHHKAPLVAPAFFDVLGMQVTAFGGVDTDQFGSFSREVARVGTAQDAAKAKARAAFAQTKQRYIIASEGSFGPHPSVPFLAAGQELLLFWDTQEDWESWESEITAETNYASSTVTTVQDAVTFAKRIGFPQHGLLIRASQDCLLGKGIVSHTHLQSLVEKGLQGGRAVTLETDMRAHMNPTRQESIRRVAYRLVERLKSECPSCLTPGFGVTGVKEGLPCESCEAPTRHPCAYVWSCLKCAFADERIRQTPSHASAGLCDHCNP